MPVPPQGELHRPLLEIASESLDTLSKKQFLEFLTKRLSLSQGDLGEKTSTGASRMEVNTAFALSKLTMAGLLHRPSRAHFRITTAGREYLKANIGKITNAVLKKLADQREFDDVGFQNGSLPSTLDPADPSETDDASPQDKIDAGYHELQEQLAFELLEMISQLPPKSFEQLVVDVLQEMGYGKGQVVGGSGDRGIDGIINQDALGLEKVYLQAKRWKSQIGEPEIRNFIGSLVAKGASKGVFVTNASFSTSARQTAQTVGNMFIRLVDGRELAKLMMDYSVGVITQYTYKIQELDENYFIDVDPDFLDRDSFYLDKYADSL